MAAGTGLGPRRRTERGWGPFLNQSGGAQRGGQQAELFAEQRWNGGDLGLALIRDGNGTRSFETLMRYRGAAMAEFMRALRTLKALQAEQAAGQVAGAQFVEVRPKRPRAPAPVAFRAEPNETKPTATGKLQDMVQARPGPGQTLPRPVRPGCRTNPRVRLDAQPEVCGQVGVAVDRGHLGSSDCQGSAKQP